MTRRKRIHLPGVPCHLTARLQGGDPLFTGIEHKVVRRLLHSVQLHRTPLIAYAVMSNHLHVVAVQTEVPLGVLMRSLLQRIGLLVQRTHGRNGHVFSGPYFVQACLDAEYLRQAVGYVHLNPVRAGLCDDAGAYAWSSHCAYVQCSEHDWRATAHLAFHAGLRLFAGRDDAPLRECVQPYLSFLSYRRKCDALFQDEHDAVLPKGLPPAPLFPAGDRHWRNVFGRPTEAAEEKMHTVPLPLPDLSTITRRVLADAGASIGVDELRAGGRSGPMVELRRAVVAQCLLAGYRNSQVARYLLMSNSAVSAVATELRQACPI